VIDSTGTILLVNDNVAGLFGYEPEEIVGLPLDALLPGRFHAGHRQHVQNFFETPRTRPMGLGLDLAGRRKDGSECPLEISLSYFETEIGRLGIAFVSDITQRKQIEQELKARNRELDAFARTVAHDLKASLQLVVGFSMELSERPDRFTPAELKAYLGEITRAGMKTATIVDSLLLFASIRKSEVWRTLLDMQPIVDEALGRLQFEIQQPGAEIVVQADLPPAAGYAPWIEEVWLNYISNALKYGGQPPRVEIGGEMLPNGNVRYRVRDNGKGLSPDERDQLFAEFTQLNPKPPGGYGLGLSIVQRIVEKLDGTVGVESEKGKGSTFYFTLPGRVPPDEWMSEKWKAESEKG
jgi:PAS domain S-box-containing protein